MVTVTASLKTGKIISVVDHGPHPGDDAHIPIMARLIAKEILSGREPRCKNISERVSWFTGPEPAEASAAMNEQLSPKRSPATK